LYSDLLADATFHELLLAFDRDLASSAREAGCGCGGVVHSAPYQRKPRGRGCQLGPEHDQRFSFCCAIDGCRTRATPPSLRFLGLSIMCHGMTEPRFRQLTATIKVNRRTVLRWRTWWPKAFTTELVVLRGSIQVGSRKTHVNIDDGVCVKTASD
jgi:hypothetical protein